MQQQMSSVTSAPAQGWLQPTNSSATAICCCPSPCCRCCALVAQASNKDIVAAYTRLYQLLVTAGYESWQDYVLDQVSVTTHPGDTWVTLKCTCAALLPQDRAM